MSHGLDQGKVPLSLALSGGKVPVSHGLDQGKIPRSLALSGGKVP